jgi:hypothetical protein
MPGVFAAPFARFSISAFKQAGHQQPVALSSPGSGTTVGNAAHQHGSAPQDMPH